MQRFGGLIDFKEKIGELFARGNHGSGSNGPLGKFVFLLSGGT